jgi:hypothetical protein
LVFVDLILVQASQATTTLPHRGIVGIACYLAFLVTVDVPMYPSRWPAGHPHGRFPGLLEGLHDVATRWVVTHDVAHWKGELAWMALYLSTAVWSSLALCALYAMEGA